ncbi:hypothetical protein IVB03_39675 [Bradyrhizobium sp. 168]|uniref:hypothetical protein n=1 Tax=Bradyrhizobium sp. 168 TaxID=2782639 RepID=UPI001FFAFC00|nr:hypothetical protein [Bradyrhizobium sp. 168]MCK1585517.1 hypothetical protein [Bradyrhizobium sp. 168]
MAITPYLFDNQVFTQASDAAPILPSYYFFNIGALIPAGAYVAATATYPGIGSPQPLPLIESTRFDGGGTFTTLNDLHSHYQFGTYTVTAFGSQPTVSTSISYQADYFTNVVPRITNFSTLSQYDPSLDFTVHYNSFTPNSNVTTGYTFFNITDALTHQVVFHSDFQNPSSTSTGITGRSFSSASASAIVRSKSARTCVAATFAALRFLVPSDFLRKTWRPRSELSTRATAS